MTVPADNKARKVSKANKVNYKLAFIPPEKDDQTLPEEERGCENGIPYFENLNWLRQWYPEARMGRVYLVVCVNECAPEEIWEMRNNHWKGTCYRVWRDPELDERSED